VKNQYFGDINDYRKYGLLRGLAASGLRVAVCWMLTPDAGGRDGRKTSYLSQPERYRAFDPHLFDALHDAVVVREERAVSAVEEVGLIPSAVYHTAVLDSDRAGYFTRLAGTVGESDLVFFDPDNGMEVKSHGKHSVGAQRYLYWDELGDSYNSGKSVLVYQHYPHSDHNLFIHGLATELQIRLDASETLAFITSDVVFFLVPQAAHCVQLGEAAQQIIQQWGREQINGRRYRVAAKDL
jgi:hypothetical protein